MIEEIYLQEKLQNLIQELKVIESNDFLEDIINSLDKKSIYYQEFKDLYNETSNDIEIEKKINIAIKELEKEIISILKFLY